MNSRRISAVLALATAFALAACTSSTSGKGSSGQTGSTSVAGTSGAPAGAASMPADAAGLGRLMQAGVAGITSAHIVLDINASGQVLTGSGDEKLANSKLVALDLTEDLPQGAGAIQVIIIDGKTYAKLPASINTTGKPYVLVTSDSSNAVVKQLASSLDSALSSASVGSVSAFVSAAKSVTRKETTTIDGVTATHYSVVVDISKLPSSTPGKDALSQSGLSTLPIELYVDNQGRPVKVTEDFQVQGEQVSTKVTVSKYNQPVSISAPPASQVATG